MRIQEHPILEFQHEEEISFTFEGQVLKGFEGEPIAAALLASGIKVLRKSPELNRPRGFFCAIGNCSSCLMEVNGKPNVRVCVEPLRAGMIVRMQEGKGNFA
ncbi:MAG: pyridine nucleotide-disulfide oxidoreductase [Candidatus Schekmanbacteria bacterium RBG_13_48_7]|uniref:Pyridine nucleotide-disulfide oxidoreductase n=1 Tax=Candidatus Schekmanbacteria bacterium RBG_13_48_7 TaxID=1817878 RepID=A0A1F7RRW9_9BACT|nr:MAG: pyridine nucleotide-disulfide oxidoreductase [Candidatus Schekmanbacteria bacterium RBG_13_48_7]